MRSALVGYTGFVGSNLASQYSFDEGFNTSNIHEIQGQKFDLVICAGIQAKKWWANQNPEEDWKGIELLLKHLETVRATRFVLISTVDVYPMPSGVDEGTMVDSAQNHAYGMNRYMAEEFVRKQFEDHLILRLPGLFGNGIKKNVIHDLLNDHEIGKINPAGVYQYYYLDRMLQDIEQATSLGIKLLNVSTEPVSTAEIVSSFFAEKQLGPETAFKASYDMRSSYWKHWGSSAEGYLYPKAVILSQMEDFFQRQTHRQVVS